MNIGNSPNDIKCKSYSRWVLHSRFRGMECSVVGSRNVQVHLIYSFRLSWLFFILLLFAMHCTMLSHHILPLYIYTNWSTCDSSWTLSSVTTAFTQIKYPLALVTSTLLNRSLCFLCRCVTQLIVSYTYISNAMEWMEINTCPWACRESQQIVYTWACGILYREIQRYKGKWKKLITLQLLWKSGSNPFH